MATAALMGAGAAQLGSTALTLAFADKNGSKISQSQLGQLRGGIKAGGLSSRLTDSNTNVEVKGSAGRQGLVQNLANVFQQRSKEFGRLRGMVRPGVGALTRARQAQLQAAERAALGDLRTNLSRRRVLGSTFATDQENAIREQFGRAGAELDAESFLQELDLSTQLYQQQSASSAQMFGTRLNELNLQAEVAQNILTQSNAGVAALSQTTSQLQQAFQQDVLGGVASGLGLLGLGVGQYMANRPTSQSQISGWNERLA